MEKFGLVGPKLAVSAGDEEELSRQLAAFAGFEPRMWHLDFVRGQVKAAKQMEDLDRRLGGLHESPGAQRLADAEKDFE